MSPAHSHMSVVSLDLDLSTHVPPAAAAQSALPLRRPEFTGHDLGRFGGGGVMEGSKQKMKQGSKRDEKEGG